MGVCLAVLQGGVGLVGSPAWADDLGPSREQVAERERGILAALQTFRRDIAGLRIQLEQGLVSSGEFDGARTWWIRSGFGIQGGLPITDKINLGISPTIAVERLKIDGSSDFITSQNGRDTRFTDFIDGALRIGADYELPKGFGLEAVTGASVRQEKGAAFDEALRFGGSIAATYRRGRWLRLRLGVGLGADLGDGQLRVSPVYRIKLRPLERLVLEASGLNGTIEWEATPRTTVSLTGGADGTQYKLERRSRPPQGLGDGTLQRRQKGMELGVVHRATDWLRIRGRFGLILDEELTVIDEDGIDVDSRVNRDPSFTTSVSFRFEL